MEHFGENLVDTLERRWEVLVKMREQETNCRRFDNTPGTRKHGATELFNERHGLSALFCSGFLTRCRLGTNRFLDERSWSYRSPAGPSDLSIRHIR
jgi:hypothetical protein